SECLLYRFEAHSMRAVRIREISRHKYQLWFHILQQLVYDAHVFGADGIFPHLAGLIEGKVEEACLLTPHSERLDPGNRFRFADRALHHLHGEGVNLAHALRVEKFFDLIDQSARRGIIDVEVVAETAQEVGVATYLVIEYGNVAGGLIGDD